MKQPYGKLRHESPEEYLAYCRQAVVDQHAFIGVIREKYQQHRYECDGHCTRCESFIETIMTNERLLDDFNKRYDDARKGIYE